MVGAPAPLAIVEAASLTAPRRSVAASAWPEVAAFPQCLKTAQQLPGDYENSSALIRRDF